MTVTGHYGYLAPYTMGPTGVPGALTSTGGTAVIGTADIMLPDAIHLEDGFHTQQAAPVAFISVAPKAAAQDPAVSLLETATVDGGIVFGALFTAGIVLLCRR